MASDVGNKGKKTGHILYILLNHINHILLSLIDNNHTIKLSMDKFILPHYISAQGNIGVHFYKIFTIYVTLYPGN